MLSMYILFVSREYVIEVFSIIIQVRGDDGAKCLDWFRKHLLCLLELKFASFKADFLLVELLQQFDVKLAWLKPTGLSTFIVL